MLVSYSKNLSGPQFIKLLQAYNADVYVVSPRGETPLIEILRRGSLEAILAAPNIPNTYVRSGREVIPPRDDVEIDSGMTANYIRWS